tara:strand:+ start:843 stop:2213 length:1371 start_codon:yes stop_codon:yes gene_type:complete
MTTIDFDLRYQPRTWQETVHRSMKRFNVCALHRRAGKTVLAIAQLLDAALRTKKDAALFAYVAPFLKQARQIAWGELKRRLAPFAAHVVISESDLAIRFIHNGARIQLFGADNPDALRGLRLDGLVVDEVAWIRPEVWTEVLQPALSDRLGWALFIGTPHGINLFSELFFAAQERPDWFAARFTCFETESLHPEEIARLKRSMPEQAFAREMLCDFAASGDDQLISLGDVELSANRVITLADVRGMPRIVGVDPARFGDDRSVIIKRQGQWVGKPRVMTGVDNMELAAQVANTIHEWDPDAVFIDAGAGAGVIDRLKQMQFEPHEIPFGGKALKDQLFKNRRSEMWSTMADWVRSGGSIPNVAALKSELATPTYSFDPVGRQVLESKDQIKRRLSGGSPDIADALALTFASPVRARDRHEPFRERRRDSQRNRRRSAYEHDPSGAGTRDHDPLHGI